MIGIKAASVLLVEDDPVDAELAFNAFQRLNVASNVIMAKDGQQALDYVFGPAPGELISQHTPGIVVLDLKLPRVDGFEVLRRIRAEERTRLIPVVVFTSSTEIRDIHRSYELGANGYVVKPVDAETYERTVALMSNYWFTVNEYPEFRSIPASS